MFCPKCGKELKDGASFCMHCGANVELKDQIKVENNFKSRKEEEIEKEVVEKDESIKNAKVSNKASKTLNIVVMILCVLVAILIGAVAMFFLGLNRRRMSPERTRRESVEIKEKVVIKGIGETKEIDGKTYYIDKDGNAVTNSWEIIDNDNHYAYFGGVGEMIKNAIKEIDGSYYYFNKDGILETNGLYEYEGKIVFAYSEGDLYRNQFKIIDGVDYYFDDDCFLVQSEGWVDNYPVNGRGELKEGYYYLDEKGQRKKSCWQGDYYLGKDGLMATSTWIGNTYVGTDGKKVPNVTKTTAAPTTVAQTIAPPTVAPSSNQVGQPPVYTGNTQTTEKPDVHYETATNGAGELIGPGAAVSGGNAGPGVAPGENTSAVVIKSKSANRDEDDSYEDDEDNNSTGRELYIKSTSTYKEEYEDEEGENTCVVTYLKPVVAGGNVDEAGIINDGINDMMDELSGLVEDMLYAKSKMPKKLTFTKATITTNTTKSFRITLTASLTSRDGDTSTQTYRIDYNRETEDMTIKKS